MFSKRLVRKGSLNALEPSSADGLHTTFQSMDIARPDRQHFHTRPKERSASTSNGQLASLVLNPSAQLVNNAREYENISKTDLPKVFTIDK